MTKQVSLLQLYGILCLKFDNQKAQSIVQFVESKINENAEEQTKRLASKEDLIRETSFITNDREKGFKVQSPWVWVVFIILILMILGLYFIIIFKK